MKNRWDRRDAKKASRNRMKKSGMSVRHLQNIIAEKAKKEGNNES